MKLVSITFVVLGLLFLSSCKLGKEGVILMTDTSYKASVFATNASMGFGSPDGLVWHKGKLYIADEGGSALEVWSKADGLKTLLDSKFGGASPEKLVVDSEDNAFFTDDDVGGLWEVDARGNRREGA